METPSIPSRDEWLERIRQSAADEQAEADDADDPLAELAAAEAVLKSFVCKTALKVAPSLSVVAHEGPCWHTRWPIPGHAQVVQTTVMGGRVARLGHTLELRPASQPGVAGEVRLADFELLTLDDESVSARPELKLLARRVAQTGTTIPPLQIDAQGAFVRFGDVKPMLRELENLGAPTSEKQLAQMQPLVTKFWYAWSHAFAGMSLEPQVGFASVPVELHILGNKRHRLEAHSTRRREHPGVWSVKLRARTPALSERPFAAALRKLLQGEDLSALDLGTLHAELSLEALLEVDTGRPLFVAREALAGFGGTDLEERELQCWEFDWAD